MKKSHPHTGQFNSKNSSGNGLVHDIRAASGLSQTELSDKLGVSVFTIRNAEMRGSSMSGTNAAALAALATELPADKRTPAISDFIESQRERYNQLHAIFGASES